MSIPNTTHRILVERLGGTDPTTFIGNEGEIFYDPDSPTPTLRLSDGSTVGGAFFSGEQRVTTIAEKSVIASSGNTANLVFGGESANLAIVSNPTGDVTLNVSNIPTDSSFDNHTITFSVVVNSTGTARTYTAVNFNGVSKTIKWAGGSLSDALSGVSTSNGYIIQSFTGINTVGSASTTDNYQVFGVVSGGFF